MPATVHLAPTCRRTDLKAYVLQRAGEFTMIPAAALQAMQIGKNPACSVAEYAATLERDVRLAADVLSTANSALHANGARAETLRDAVVRLGLRRCQSIILQACTAALMRALPFNEANRRQLLWSHGYMTGVICRHLNQELSLGFQGEEFTAGLIHDLGRSLLAATAPADFNAADSLSFREDEETIERERRILGTDHCELGALFASQNRFPESLTAVIMYHHTPRRARVHRQLVALVAVADHMANHVEARWPAEAYDPAANPFLEHLSTDGRLAGALSTVAAGITGQAFSESCQLIAG